MQWQRCSPIIPSHTGHFIPWQRKGGLTWDSCAVGCKIATPLLQNPCWTGRGRHCALHRISQSTLHNELHSHTHSGQWCIKSKTALANINKACWLKSSRIGRRFANPAPLPGRQSRGSCHSSTRPAGTFKKFTHAVLCGPIETVRVNILQNQQVHNAGGHQGGTRPQILRRLQFLGCTK